MNSLYEHIAKQANGCWNWTGTFIQKNGPVIQKYYGGQPHTFRARRVMWNETHAQPVASDHVIRTTCGNPHCVCPDHLYMQHRHALLSEAGKAKRKAFIPDQPVVTEDLVRRIRQMHQEGISQAEIRRRTGVPRRNLWAIVHRHSWRHI